MSGVHSFVFLALARTLSLTPIAPAKASSVLSNVRIADIGDFVFIEVFAQVVSACPKDVAHILT